MMHQKLVNNAMTAEQAKRTIRVERTPEHMLNVERDDYKLRDMTIDGLWCEAIALTKGPMQEGADLIDQQFGTGYAKEHPELVAQYMRTASEEYRTGMLYYLVEKYGPRFVNRE
jgi:hypothetical protein